ncbi:type II toxin-antitoxin system VapC family toxin [Desulfurivibrio sp. D14AmB]|uniref:type II toxin-antitoxin system VapC family toxin n=1 Tax=Desulfurivibrio sp. D14AmB TaxID=3374370 RepID=UPI00376EBD36
MSNGTLPVIILDTCVLIFDSLTPERLSKKALTVINRAEGRSALCCSDISLWEIAMLTQKGRLQPGTDSLTYLQLVLDARQINILPITPRIAHLSVSMPEINHHDPADRIIVATAKEHRATLVTVDQKLLGLKGITTIW